MKGDKKLQNLFKYKLFIILLLFIVLVTSIYSNCFASNNISYSYNGKIYTVNDFSNLIPNDCKYFICLSNDSNAFPFLFIVDKDTRQYICQNSGKRLHSLSLSRYKRYIFRNNKWELQSSYLEDSSYYVVFCLSFIDNKYSILYSNINFYGYYDYIGDTEEVVFQGAPVTVEQVTIPEIQAVEEIPQTMSKVLEMIIPIGLIVLSIGLLIYLMRLVILRMR